MIQAIAIDDENMALSVIKAHAAKVPFIELLETFTDGVQGLEYMKTNPVQLVFLDINMPDISGIDLATLLPKDCLVIFTTAYAEYAVQGFELQATDYLLKPFSFTRFLKACQKVQQWLELQPDNALNYIFVKTSEGQIKLRYDQLLCCEANGNYVTFHLPNEKIMSRLTLVELEKVLPSYFLKVHRSYIINTKLVDKVERHQVNLGNFKAPVSNSYLDQVAQFFI